MLTLAMGLALVLDRLLGWPDPLVRAIGHPVIWIGRLISTLERRLNAGTGRRWKGVLCVALTVAAAVLPAWGVQVLLPNGLLGAVLMAFVAAPFLASHSLLSHVRAVAFPLTGGDIPSARRAVSHIVGRDPEALDAPAIARAATESLAENTSDGIVAPLFWGLILGLPGLVGYKAINTLDSMIGYRSARYRAFGWAAARLDDAVNLMPARLTGVLYAVLGARGLGDLGRILRLMWREAPRHRSPNAGWPEAAMAACLGIRLSGPRQYNETWTTDPWLNGTAPDPTGADVARAVRLCDRLVWALAAGGLGVGVVLL